VAIILSASMMLAHLSEFDAARAVRDAVIETLDRGDVRTQDLGGTAGTDVVASAVADAVRLLRMAS
jgi:tartrate dehydrogenase/decarboxylase/D-malate dehydrogenase